MPQVIKIATHSYRVEYNPLLWYEEGLKGCVNHIREVIQIDPRLSESQKVVTFLHEVNHVISDVFHCKLDDDEIDKIAEGTAELLVDNLDLQFDWSEIKVKEEK